MALQARWNEALKLTGRRSSRPLVSNVLDVPELLYAANLKELYIWYRAGIQVLNVIGLCFDVIHEHLRRSTLRGEPSKSQTSSKVHYTNGFTGKLSVHNSEKQGAFLVRADESPASPHQYRAPSLSQYTTASTSSILLRRVAVCLSPSSRL